MQNNYKLPALILGLCIVAAFSVFAYSFYSAKQLDNYLSVTGSATKKITSDSAKWVLNFNRVVEIQNVKSGYTQMAKDTAVVTKFLKDNGITDEQMTISPVFMNMNYYYDKGASAPKEYTLNQNVEINSPDVNKITELSKNTQGIVDQGVLLSTQGVEYYYTKLSDLRVTLLPDAMKDAHARATAIAESGGKKVSSLKSASMGVVQVMSANSIDVSDYGSYDTSKIEKQVMVTVRASYNLK
jgi:hypothetical protein